jgi:hypothetical protein
LLGAMLKNSPKLTIDLVVHVKGKASLAKARAIAVRNYIVTYVPSVEKKQLPISWFGQAERVGAGKKAQNLSESVRFITNVK